jgi:hypothetical protein
MSAAKSIDSQSVLFSLVAIFATVVFGCSPRETVAPTNKTAAKNVPISPNVDSGTIQNPDQKSTPSHSSEKPAPDALQPTPAEPAPNTTKGVEVPPAVEPQPPPKDALALRQEAKQLADKLIDRFPNNPDALEIKARFLMLFGETEVSSHR